MKSRRFPSLQTRRALVKALHAVRPKSARSLSVFSSFSPPQDVTKCLILIWPFSLTSINSQPWFWRAPCPEHFSLRLFVFCLLEHTHLNCPLVLNKVCSEQSKHSYTGQDAQGTSINSWWFKSYKEITLQRLTHGSAHIHSLIFTHSYMVWIGYLLTTGARVRLLYARVHNVFTPVTYYPKLYI